MVARACQLCSWQTILSRLRYADHMHETFGEQLKRELNVWRRFYAGLFSLRLALLDSRDQHCAIHPSIYPLHHHIMNAYLFTKRNKIVRPLEFPSARLPFSFFRHFLVSSIHSHWRRTVKWIAYIEFEWMAAAAARTKSAAIAPTHGARRWPPLENYFSFREIASEPPQRTNLNPNGVAIGWINLFASLSFQSKCVMFELRCVWAHSSVPFNSIQFAHIPFFSIILFCFPHSTHD